MIERVSHLGIAVNDLEAAIRLYRDVLGLELVHRWTAEADGMEACAFRVGEIELELMQPTREDSPVARFLAKRGEGIHHVSFKVGDVATALEEASEKGIETVDKAPRSGGDGKTLVAFLHPKSTAGVLMELEEDVRE